MARTLHPRVAAWLLLPIVAAALWLLFSQDRAPADATSGDGSRLGVDPHGAPLDPSSQAGAEESELTRNKVPGSADSAFDPLAEDDGPPVHLRVLLRVYDEEGEERIPANCAGWVVRAQSWITETGEVAPHEAAADARGVAEFTFPGFVHVDWVGCAPPQRTGLGFSQMSEHTDFDGGSEEEWTLILQLGGGAHGRVLTMDDRPVAGAEVQAFDPNWSSEFGSWTPGFLITRTASDGSFFFASLGEGEWNFAVAPGEYLQLLPMLGDANEGEGYAEVVAGETADAGVLRVLSAFIQEIRVIDADGEGVPNLTFAITALDFVSQGLRAAQQYYVEDEEDTSDWMTRFIAGEDPTAWLDSGEAPEEEPSEDERPEWPYDGIATETGADGRVSWQLPAGRYSVECWTTVPGLPGGTISPFEVSAPRAPVVFRLPVRCASWSGSIVDDLGDPVADASLSLTWSSEDSGSWDAYVESDARGAFQFVDVPLIRDCELVIACGGYVTSSWRVSLLEAPSAPYCLPRGGSLHVSFKDPEGAPFNIAGAHPRLRAIRTEIPPPAPGTLGGKTRAVGSLTYSSSQNQLHADQLAQGEYELKVTLHYYHASTLMMSWSGPSEAFQSSESVEIGAWMVKTGAEWNVITLDAEQCAKLQPQTGEHSGVVLDAATDQPVPGASVTALGFNLKQASRTDINGRFSMELTSGNFVFQVAAAGYEVLEVEAAAMPNDGSEHEFRLQHGGATVHVRVLDRDGRRLPPCTADVLFPGASGDFPPSSPAEGISGMELPFGEMYFQSKTLGRHRMRLNFAPGVHAEVSFELRQTRDYAPADCRLSWTLDDLRAALRAAQR